MNYGLEECSTEVVINASVIEDNAKEQVMTLSEHPAFHGLISIMPDVHLGKAGPIGFTGQFKDAVIPNIVGVDIGCFSGDTKVPLINGSIKSLKELAASEVTMEGFKEKMKNVYSTCVDEKHIDESPSAYKGFESIREHLEETVEITHRLKPVYNLKG